MHDETLIASPSPSRDARTAKDDGGRRRPASDASRDGVALDREARAPRPKPDDGFFRYAPILVAEIGPSGRLLRLSASWETVFGAPPAPLLGAAWLDLVHDDDRAAAAAAYARLAARGDLEGVDLRIRAEGGAARIVRWTAFVDENGVVHAYGQDVTLQRALERRLHQSQKHEAIARLAGGVAHDFNNVLAVILADGEWVLEALGEEHPVAPELRSVLTAAERAAGLSRQLLAFGRESAPMSRPLGLNAVAREIESMLRRLLGPDVALRLALASDVHAVHADPGQIGQVVLNLALNARDAMPKGGTLTIATRDVEVDDAASRALGGIPPGPYAQLSVTDTGVGIEPAVLPRIFDPFFTTKDASRGTGLGLATVRSIVRASGGAVAVESALGRGTTFHVYLPRAVAVAAAPSAPAADPKTKERTKGRGATVLLVEDDDPVRRVIARALRSDGYMVLEAKSGAEARAAAKGAPLLDLLVTDLVLDGESGRALATEVQAARPGVAVLFVSGYSDPTLGTGARFLAKPFNEATLLGAVRAALPPVGSASAKFARLAGSAGRD